MRIFYDIETNAIKSFRTLEGLEVIHCIVAQDIDTGEVYKYHDSFEIGDRDGTVDEGVGMIEEALIRAAHNGRSFDERVIKLLHPDYSPKGELMDTLTMSRVTWPDLKERDWLRINRGVDFPTRFAGKHSLESWGYRLGSHKGDMGDTKAEETWAVFTEKMLEYCVQDVALGVKLFQLIESRNPQEALEE